MKIISISDLITNSSSEVFCYITGPETELHEIFNILDSIFGYNQEYEVTPVVGKDEYNDKPCVSVDLPYHMTGGKANSFWQGAINALVKQFDNCNIKYHAGL